MPNMPSHLYTIGNIKNDIISL